MIDWKGLNLRCANCKSLNRIIVKNCVKFYNKCWRHRNEVFHGERKQKDRMEKIFEKEKRRTEGSECRQIR